MGQARAKKLAKQAWAEAFDRGQKRWDKSVLREVLRSIVPAGVEAVATRYNPPTQELLISCDDGEVRRVPWQTMIDAEREQAPKLVIPSTHVEHKADEFLAQAKQDQQAKLEAIQQAMREQCEQLEQARQQHEQEQRQQRDAERGPDWELAAARCAELEISLRPKELLCCCQRGQYGHHSTHLKGNPCPEKGVYAVQCTKHMRRENREPVLCEACALEQIPRDDEYKLDCEP